MQYVVSGFLAACGTAIAGLTLGGMARATPWARRRVARWKQRGDTLDEMIAQFRPNGGMSMYDRVARGERNIAKIADHFSIEIEQAPPEYDREGAA